MDKHDQIPLFFLRTNKIFSPFPKENKIATSFPKKWQRMLYVFLICFLSRDRLAGLKFRIGRIVSHITES